MSIIVSDSGGHYEPHPSGQFAAVCCDVVDMGWTPTKWGPKYKVRVVFFCGLTEDREIEGEKRTIPLTVSEFFTASLNEKANLRGFLESWRGVPFTVEEAARFDLERMLNAPAFVQVTHNTSPATGKTYANIKSIMRLPQGMEAPEVPADYVRVCHRPDWTGPATHPDHRSENEDQSTQDEDDDLPF